MKKILTVGLALLFLSLPGLSQEKRNSLSLLGGMNFVPSYGSEDDYAPGENDFPVTPAHVTPSFGFSFIHAFSGLLGLELDGRFMPAATVTLTDPSDDDTVDVQTLKHASVSLSVLVFIGRGALRPYLALGGGGDFVLDAQEQTLETSLGYEVTFVPPEKKYDIAAHAGGGVLVGLGSRFGLRVDVRYILLPKTSGHPMIHNVNAQAGLFLRLF